MSALAWLPAIADFRGGLKAALAVPDAPQRFEALARLADHRLGFLETIQLDNALTREAKTVQPDWPRLRVALLGSSTVDHLAPPLRIAALRVRLTLDVHVGGFGQYRQELLDPGSSLAAFAPQYVILMLGQRELIGSIPLGASRAEAQAALDIALADLRTLWRTARERFGCTVIQQTLLDVSEPVFGGLDAQVPGAPARLTSLLNEQLAEAAAADQVLLLDVARCAARDGLAAWFDTARWLQAKIEIAPQAGVAFADLALRLIQAQRGQSRKCLVLDLDNTLWGGVVGDVGADGIVLGQGSAAGEAHAALQRHAKLLGQRGVILAVCSKNETAVVEEVFRSHPEMVLRQADIAAFAVNWNDKAENLRAIAARLNIGLDSLVFVDDNPAERARVREALPMVAVPELPDDPAGYVACVARAGYFESVAYTDEDRQRSDQYAANLQRDALRESAQSMDDFLRGLEMAVVYGPVGQVDLPRVTQLLNKTNQFNTTTLRMSAEEVAGVSGAARSLVLQFRLLDRLGDNGLVSVMILSPLADEPQSMEIVNWVMSCRVFGRQLEDEALNIAVEASRARGARQLRARFVPTKKNGVIAELFPRLGFAAAGAAADGSSQWQLDLAAYTHRPTHITRRSEP